MAQTIGPSGVEDRAFEALATGFQGQLIRPADPTYEEHRAVWNGSIDRRPALIARCAAVADVAAAVRFGRITGLTTAVRGGGHSFPGHSVCDDGLVIDLSLMKDIHVDPDRRTARVQPGVLLGELDAATQPHGLAVPAGIVTHTGLAGLTLGGGIGWLMRKHGLTIDQLLRVELIGADGEPLAASADENPDLFWAMRGAGANFGVVTQFEFRLNPVGPEILGGPIAWPMQMSPEVLRFYRDWITDAPDELTTIVFHRRAPALPFVPPEFHGEPIVSIACCYAGPREEGERILAPLKAFGSPALDLCGPMPFVGLQGMFDASFPQGWWYYFRSCDVAELSDDVIDITVEHALRIDSPLTAFPIFHLGGAVGRVGEDDTAFNGRGAGHTFNINATTETSEGFDKERQWAQDFWTALAPHHTGTYVNFLSDEPQERVRAVYGNEKYERLVALKTSYDPTNFFHHNQNITPA
jgi:hypothetical protein